jgi:hypothetical protein
VRNEDPGDLARRASVSASTEYEDPATGMVYSADKVIEGVSRGREGDENMWISDPVSPFYPAFLQLDWEEPITCNAIHLTFDTTVREQRFFDRVRLGAMPTCVRDYGIYHKDAGGEWKALCERKGNFQRHNVLRFDRITTGAMRIQVEATNGDLMARIYEVRVYDEDG